MVPTEHREQRLAERTRAGKPGAKPDEPAGHVLRPLELDDGGGPTPTAVDARRTRCAQGSGATGLGPAEVAGGRRSLGELRVAAASTHDDEADDGENDERDDGEDDPGSRVHRLSLPQRSAG